MSAVAAAAAPRKIAASSTLRRIPGNHTQPVRLPLVAVQVFATFRGKQEHSQGGWIGKPSEVLLAAVADCAGLWVPTEKHVRPCVGEARFLDAQQGRCACGLLSIRLQYPQGVPSASVEWRAALEAAGVTNELPVEQTLLEHDRGMEHCTTALLANREHQAKQLQYKNHAYAYGDLVRFVLMVRQQGIGRIIGKASNDGRWIVELNAVDAALVLADNMRAMVFSAVELMPLLSEPRGE